MSGFPRPLPAPLRPTLVAVSVLLSSGVLGLAIPALVDAATGVARIGLLLASTLLAVAALGRNRAYAASGLILAVASVLASTTLQVAQSPLGITATPTLLAVVLLGVTAMTLLRPGWGRVRSVFGILAGALSASLVLTAAVPDAADATGLLLWALAVGGSSVAMALAFSRTLGREVGVPVFATALAASAFAWFAASARQVAVLALEDAPAQSESATWALLGLGGLWTTSAFLVFLVAFGSARAWKSALATAAAVVALGAFVPASQATPAPVDNGLLELRDASEHRIGLSSGMVEEAGAGPRSEFRGLGFYDCDRINSRDCFITHYDDIALRHGVAAAVEDLAEKVKNNKGRTFPAHCHQVVHNLGQMAFEIVGDFDTVAGIDPQVCGTGYTHGIWEQHFNLISDERLFSRAPTLCQDLNMVTDWYSWTCNHILGHILTTRMMENPGLALEGCAEINDTQAVVDCLAGGWMNFFQDDGVIAFMEEQGSVRDLFGVCYSAADEVKFLCYQELFPVIYAMVDSSDYLAGQACLEYSEESPLADESADLWSWDYSYTDRCIQGLARAVAVSSNQDYRLIIPRCQSMPEEARDACLTAAGASLTLNTGSVAGGFEVCRAVADQEYRTYCYFWIKHSYKMLANGPNNENLPALGEIRLPEDTSSPVLTPTPEISTGPSQEPSRAPAVVPLP